MKRIPQWAKRPVLIALGILFVEPIRWSLGSALDEIYQSTNWRWTEVGAAVFEWLSPLSYAVMAAGLIWAMILAFRGALSPVADGQVLSPAGLDGIPPQAVVKRQPDYNKWRSMRTLRLCEAAALWEEESPLDGISDTAKETLAMLVRAAEDGELESLRPEGLPGLQQAFSGRINGETRVTQSSLKVYAATRGADPLFLREAEDSRAVVRAARASLPGPTKKALEYPYRHAVLRIVDLKPSRQRQGSSFTRADCYLEIKNESAADLKHCSVHIVSIEWGGGREALDTPVYATEFDLKKHAMKRIPFVVRDLADVVTRPPHLLVLAEGRRWPLTDGTVYSLEMELRSEYEYPTLVTIKLDVPADPQAAVLATYERQRPDDRP